MIETTTITEATPPASTSSSLYAWRGRCGGEAPEGVRFVTAYSGRCEARPPLRPAAAASARFCEKLRLEFGTALPRAEAISRWRFALIEANPRSERRSSLAMCELPHRACQSAQDNPVTRSFVSPGLHARRQRRRSQGLAVHISS